jgi:hypothetical protein
MPAVPPETLCRQFPIFSPDRWTGALTMSSPEDTWTPQRIQIALDA